MGVTPFAVPRRPKRLRRRRADRRNPLDHAAMSTRSATMKGLLNHSIATAAIPWMRRPDATAADPHAVLAIPAGARELERRRMRTWGGGGSFRWRLSRAW